MICRSIRKVSRHAARIRSNFTTSHTNEPEQDINWTQRREELDKLYTKNQQIEGFCTKEGTETYSKRNPEVDESNWKKPIGLDVRISSVGVGTYSTDMDDKHNIALFNAIIDSVMSGGVNLIDTCISFRHCQSERIVNAALRYLEQKGYKRSQLFLMSKGGYLAEDADNQTKASDDIKDFISQKLIKEQDIMNGSHCIHPEFIELSLQKSLINLGVSTLDAYFLNNAIENHLPFIGQAFYDRLAMTFERLEKMVSNNKIKSYGVASWAALRLPSSDKDHCDLQKLVNVAKKVAGNKHNFRFVQLPINAMMAEAFGDTEQNWLNPQTKKVEQHPILTVANRQKINVISCSPLMNGILANVPMPSEPLKVSGIGAKHLQFLRSIPATALLSTLIGQKRNRHVKSNLEVIYTPRMTREEWTEFLRPAVRKQTTEKN